MIGARIFERFFGREYVSAGFEGYGTYGPSQMEPQYVFYEKQ